jgi:hypothetical protein
MEKEEFIFTFVVEDYDDLDKLTNSIKNILKLKKNEKFMGKLLNQYEDGYMEIKKDNLTINITKKVDEDLPF